MINRLLILSFIIILTSCSDSQTRRKEIVANKIDLINKNRTEWENLTKDILDDSYINQHIGKFISPSELNENLKERLMKYGINHLSVKKQENCEEVEYATDWTKYPIGTLYLTWTTCDKVQTKNGYYLDNFKSNFIEVWGVGGNWLIWVDSDFI